MSGRAVRRTYLEAHMDERKGFSRTTTSVHETVSSGTDSSAFLGSVLSHTLIATEPSVLFPARRHKKRGSLSALIGNLPKDISLLIRSHSSSRRPLRQIQDTHDSSSDMLQDDERPARKTFRENRLYRFITRSLTRSRSRSRSRTGRDTPPPVDLNEPVPDIPPSRNGRARIDSMGQSGPSKPVTRIPSRPLSSTTAGTNTTITPTTPRAKKRPPSSIPIPKDSTPRPASTKAPAPRKKLHTIFGIPLSSPQKPHFTSPNHSSTRLSPDVHPPGHDDFQDDDPTPKALKYFPQSHSRPESPSPAAQQKLSHNPSNSSAGTSAPGSSKLQRHLNGGPKTPPPPSADVVSAPIRRPSISSHRRDNSASTSISNRSSPSSARGTIPVKPKAAGSIGLPPIPLPRIAYTPPTPQQERPGLPGHAPEIAKSSSLGHSSRKNSADHSRRVEGEDGLGDLNGHARVKMGHSRGHSRRSTKHGSFDFERPGWSASMQRTVSGATTGSGTSTTGNDWGRGLDGLVGGIRESAMGPGLAGVGTLQRDVSLRRGKEREEMLNRVREEQRRRRRAEVQCKEKSVAQEFGVLPPKSQTLQTPAARALSPEDARATASGKSSSWGKKHGTLLGKAKVTTLGVSLGPFAFEPPVPSPTWSTTSAGNVPNNNKDAPLTVSWAGEKGRDKPQLKIDLNRDKERWLDREKERRSQSAQRGDRAPVPVPVPVASATMGYRSGMKGRSLDLGLGLSWAPSSVREDALLPSSVLLSRSTSSSSSLLPRFVGKSVSGSANGHSTIEENPLLASEVAKVFKTTLDEMGYKTFKRYVDRFDAHEIPFDGPTGIVTRVERLLTSAPGLNEESRQQLLDNFIRVVLQHA